jgi:hypothetical protein
MQLFILFTYTSNNVCVATGENIAHTIVVSSSSPLRRAILLSSAPPQPPSTLGLIIVYASTFPIVLLLLLHPRHTLTSLTVVRTSSN